MTDGAAKSDGSAILIVEDHEESRASLAYALEKRGHLVQQAASGKAALAIARRTALHAAVLDLRLPDMEGISVLTGILHHLPGLPVVVVSAYASVDSAVEAMRRGASDFLTKPFKLDDLTRVLDRYLARARESGAIAGPVPSIVREMERFGLTGGSAAMRELFERVKRVAPNYRTLLISGESGTGKELVARALHTLGPGPTRPFVAVNCATLSEPLLESEIFGHERGAFTGAEEAKAGMMETADGGTLFLDEVNEMGLSCQAKLLRAVERREFRRVGGTRKLKVDIRVIGASNASLEEWVAARRFREDLYYRLKVLSLTLPPLRERREEVRPLAERFLEDVAQAARITTKKLTPAALRQLQSYDWPGNVRELKNAMESLTLMNPSALISAGDVSATIRGVAPVAIQIRVGTSLAEAERRIIQRTLESQPTVKETARVLGIGLRTLHTKLRQYGIERRRKAPG